MRAARSLLMLLRLLIAAQIIVGIGLWLGYWYGLVNLHMGLGSLFVLVLWIIAIMALVKRRVTGLAIGAIIWGLIIAAFGMAQRQILVGELHWIVRLVHLVIGVAAIPMAEGMTRAITEADAAH